MGQVGSLLGEGEPWEPWRRVNLGVLDRRTADPEGRGWAWLIRVRAETD